LKKINKYCIDILKWQLFWNIKKRLLTWDGGVDLSLKSKTLSLWIISSIKWSTSTFLNNVDFYPTNVSQQFFGSNNFYFSKQLPLVSPIKEWQCVGKYSWKLFFKMQ